METHLSFDRVKERDCVKANSLRRCALENGKMTTHLGDFGVGVGVGVGVGGGGEGDTKGAALCPITPIPCRGSGEPVFVLSTPLSSESPQSPTVKVLDSSSSDEVVGSVCVGSPRTPEEGVFNPFAPGPEEMCLAPFCKKLVKESRRIVARRLNFDDVEEFNSVSSEDDKEADIRLEKILVETVYETLLEAIILKQTEDFLAENQDLDLEGCRTPTSPLPLTGIAETCPGAPSKATERKTLNIDPGLCRKLEF